MTAILGTSYSGAPLIMGDVVVSMAAHLAPTTPYVPSVGRVDVSSNARSRLRIAGLVQKVSLLGPNLAVAWSGDLCAAKNLLERIRDANNIQCFDYGSLVTLLDQDSPSIIRGDVGLIGLLIDGQNIRMFARNVPFQEDPTFAGIWADGTGAESLITQLRQFCISSTSAGSTPTHNVICLGVSLSGTLITHEVHHLDSLRSGFGGAYEIATIINGTCAKVQDVMYVQWFANMNEDGFSLRSLSRLFRYSYWNDVLIVRSVKFTNGIEANPDEDDSYTLIPPVFRELTPDDIRLAPIPQLAAPIVAHQITFRALDRNVYTVTKTAFGDSADFRVAETLLSGPRHEIQVQIADHFVNETNAEIRRLMRGLDEALA